MQDVPLQVISHNSRSERRISPSWTVFTLQGKLEPITGIPASAQRLSLRAPSYAPRSLDNGDAQLSAFDLQHYSELHVCAPPSSDVLVVSFVHGPSKPFRYSRLGHYPNRSLTDTIIF